MFADEMKDALGRWDSFFASGSSSMHKLRALLPTLGSLTELQCLAFAYSPWLDIVAKYPKAVH